MKEDQKNDNYISKMGKFGIDGLEPNELYETEKELKRLQTMKKVNK